MKNEIERLNELLAEANLLALTNAVERDNIRQEYMNYAEKQDRVIEHLTRRADNLTFALTESVEAMQDFCDKVDSGTAKSIKSYNKFQTSIAYAMYATKDFT